MRKLMMLLNEYEKDGDWYVTYIIKGEKSERELQSSYMFDEDKNAIQNHIISKSFWFIKWLVKNNKIDNSKLSRESDMWFGNKYEREESLLMLLAISDNPIEDLISYLK